MSNKWDELRQKLQVHPHTRVDNTQVLELLDELDAWEATAKAHAAYGAEREVELGRQQRAITVLRQGLMQIAEGRPSLQTGASLYFNFNEQASLALHRSECILKGEE